MLLCKILSTNPSQSATYRQRRSATLSAERRQPNRATRVPFAIPYPLRYMGLGVLSGLRGLPVECCYDEAS